MMDRNVLPIETYERSRANKEPCAPTSTFVTTSTTALMATEFPPVQWVIPDYIAEGLVILAGRQKLGKTWLAMDFAIAVATGGFALGRIPCEQGDVLYVDLENGPRRVQRRINTIFPGEANRPDLSQLIWTHGAPRLDKGLVDALDAWHDQVRQPRLVIIDVLQGVKPPSVGRQNAYESDYAALAPLQRWAGEHKVAVVCLHHTRKGGADDPLESLSGSNGLSACADTTLVLDNRNGKTLYVRGRDVEEKESALNFEGGIWTLVGDAVEARRSDARSRILSVLLIADGPMRPGEIAIATGMSRNNVDQLLYKMAQTDEVRKDGRGKYAHPERQEMKD
jgi:hypothetical protein